MRRIGAAAALLLTGAGLSLGLNPGARADDAPAARTPSPYPPAPRGDVIDTYHGTAVPDPYRWLEELDSPATRAWIEAENRVTDAYLAAVPSKGAIQARLTKLWNYAKYSPPIEQGGRYFYRYNSGLQNQPVLYVTTSLSTPATPLIDPNTLSKEGTTALQSAIPSKDGTRLAYALAEAGSDWITWKVRDVATGQDTSDVVRWSKFSEAAWTPDGSGFFYGRFPEPQPGADLKAANFHQKVYFHKLGTPQDADQLVWKDDAHQDWRADARVSDDSRYLILTLGKGTDEKHKVLYRPLAEAQAAPTFLVGDFDHEYTYLDNDGPVFWFLTDRNASRRRVIAIDTRKPAEADWVEIIPEAAETLQAVHRVGDRFIGLYLKDARSQVKVFSLAGKLVSEVELPGLGTVTGFEGDRDDTETFYAFTSYTRPTTVYRYDLKSGQSTVFKAPELGFDPDAFETRQVFYTSKDGTRIPMFLSHKKGLQPTADTPCLLYGYGGFNIPLTPDFRNPAHLVWMELGGIYAVANLRGGGEYGEAWHQAGTKLKKQNVFDDFIAAAQWLIDQKLTSTPKLAIEGRSNGGLLVGACLTQRPDLYGAALPGVGVLDMLRFHKFTIGWAWIDDFGSSDDSAEFKALRAYSPLHNIKPGTCYPPTLITTADHDDRVYPAHSFKFAAALQAAQACDNPTLIRIETNAGHGAGKPTAKLIEDTTDKLSFLVRALKLDVDPARLGH